ncbi:multiheme c-type cytochrome, partial [Burkholderiales bacterium]|nr:multiheme c-type cytochrome [Burkholderiales bacterium]
MKRFGSWWLKILLACSVTLSFSFAFAERNPVELTSGTGAHLDILMKDEFPSATKCAMCHQKVFWEWASSNHAYASVSPMFHKFEQAVNALTDGTMGTFCTRCHQQVGTQKGEPRELPLWDRSIVAREGITCITCHRVNAQFGKVNGERHINPGTIYDPV